MQNRMKHFRAGLLLVLSSALIFWVISYWLPLPSYLSAVSSDKYADYQLTIQLFVGAYLTFFILTLVSAGLAFTRLPSTVKFYLTLIPASIIFILPFLLAIPIAFRLPERNYFEIFMAMFRLFRFTRLDLFVAVLVVTTLACFINIFAAIIMRRAGEVEKVSKKIQTNYMIYSGVAVLVLVASIGINFYNATVRSVDRVACYDYRDLELPVTDKDIVPFLNNIQLYGEQAGSEQLRNALVNFANASRQYYAVMNTDAGEGTIAQFQVAAAQAKVTVTDLCSEFATD
jgi:hypothetical protein